MNTNLGLLPDATVATIGKDGNFALSQLNEDTLLIMIDEWSEDVLGEDTLKQLLQGTYRTYVGESPPVNEECTRALTLFKSKRFFAGGYVTVVRKNKDQCRLRMECPIYLTTNLLPHFRHPESIMCRLARYNTKSLPVRRPRVGPHFRTHAMEHLHWIASQIDEHRDRIPPEELYYETLSEEPLSQLQQARETEIALLRSSTQLSVPGMRDTLDIAVDNILEVSDIFHRFVVH